MILQTIIWKNITIMMKRKLVLLIMIILPLLLCATIFKLRIMSNVTQIENISSISREVTNTDIGLYWIFESEHIKDYNKKRRLDSTAKSGTMNPTKSFRRRHFNGNIMKSFVYYNKPTCKNEKILKRFDTMINEYISDNLYFQSFDDSKSTESAMDEMCPPNKKSLKKCDIFASVYFQGDMCSRKSNNNFSFVMVPSFGYQTDMYSDLGFYWQSDGWPGVRMDESNRWQDTYRVASLQSHLSRVIRSSYSGIPRHYQSVLNTRFPYRKTEIDFGMFIVYLVISIMCSLVSIFFIGSFARDLSSEKETRMKEQLKLMGVSTANQWLALWFQYAILLLLVFFAICQMIIIPVEIDQGRNSTQENNQTQFPLEKMAPIRYSCPYALFVFLAGYGISALSFAMMISSLFDDGMKSACATVVINILLIMPGIVVSNKLLNIPYKMQVLMGFIFEFNKCIGIKYIEIWESQGEGIQFSNYNKKPNLDYEFTMLHFTMFHLASALAYTIIAAYIESVNPGRYGMAEDFTFPIKWIWNNIIYLCESDPHKQFADELMQYKMRMMEAKMQPLDDDVFIEDTSELAFTGIEIANLTKEFPDPETGTKVAVNNLNLSMNEGQITVLLGHNGAGKTTTMFLLTGFLTPTSGNAYIYGMDTKRRMDEIRRITGLCPQHNILYPLLTVDEHLKFIRKLNPSDVTELEITQILTDIDLLNKRSFASKDLSGGMKRKLSIVQAIIGGSKVVILDEPTSGLDPEARRQTWSVLKKHCKGKTLLISTHYMDEAEFLGDRIAIMSRGKLQSYGTSMFLKNKYGSGYKLSMTKSTNVDIPEITKMLRTYIPNAKVISDVGAELCYELPGHDTSIFSKMFNEFESKMVEFGVLSFGVSITTMEDVFIKVGQLEHEKLMKLKENPTVQYNDVDSFEKPNDDDVITTSYVFLICQQIFGMISKRIKHTRKQLLVTLIMVTLPSLVICIAMIMQRHKSASNDIIPLGMERFSNKNFTIIIAGISNNKSVAKMVLDEFKINTMEIEYPLMSEYASDIDEYFSIVDDTLLNITSDISDYMHRYIGALLFDDTVRIVSNEHIHYSDIILNGIVDTVTAMNYQAKDVIPYKIKSYLKSAKKDDQTSVSTSSNMRRAKMVNTLTICVIFPMVMSSIAMFVTEERVSGTKGSQVISGLSISAYWISNFFFDLIICSYMNLVMFIGFFIFGLESFATIPAILVFQSYSIVSIPYMYMFSFYFKSQGSTFVWASFINISSGSILPMIMDVAMGSQFIEIVSMIFPNTNLYFSIKRLMQLEQGKAMCPPLPSGESYCNNDHQFCCMDICKEEDCAYIEPWDFDRGVPGYISTNISTAVLYFCLVLMVDKNIWMLLKNILTTQHTVTSDSEPKDADVKEEKDNVLKMSVESTKQHAVVLNGLIKVYRNDETGKDHMAVNNLYAAIEKGQCFGLLGVNGAGKTSTFAMLTGMQMISGGSAKINGLDVEQEMTSIYSNIGYCQQYDKLFEYMTCKENMNYYCQLKGIKFKARIYEVKRLLSATLLLDYSNLMAGLLSGGNKRKLSTAISMIGNPKVVFLDEPTCGMDPVARRHSWSILSTFTKSDRTIILTSHSMEECEALCKRLVIMVKGEFRCIGTPQHLKNIYGHNYTLTIQLHADHDIHLLDRFISSNLYKVTRVSYMHGQVIYKIFKQKKLTWSFLFKVMEKMKQKSQLKIQDYSLSQPSLEQIFIDFAEENSSAKKELSQKNTEVKKNADKMETNSDVLLNDKM